MSTACHALFHALTARAAELPAGRAHRERPGSARVHRGIDRGDGREALDALARQPDVPAPLADLALLFGRLQEARRPEDRP